MIWDSLLLIADHRPPGSVLPIYAVTDLEETTDALVTAGWTHHLGPLGTPDGPAIVLVEASGTALALLRVDRPGAMDAAYADSANVDARRAP